MSCMILLKNHIVSAYSSLADNNAEYDFIVQRLINCNDLNELHKEIEKIISRRIMDKKSDSNTDNNNYKKKEEEEDMHNTNSNAVKK